MKFESINEVYIKWRKDIDNAILGEIKEKAIEHGIKTEYILNEKAIISALEKQIPKKIIVKKVAFDTLDFICPRCAKKQISRCAGVWVAGQKFKYCSDCGQKLDWSDTE